MYYVFVYYYINIPHFFHPTQGGIMYTQQVSQPGIINYRSQNLCPASFESGVFLVF